jgi:tetratricopeptide (TPR) repeat protein
VHIWAEDYDRQLTDIFAIQEDIARAITTSLRMPLGLKPGDTLVHGTDNLGTYQEYLQAKAWYRDRNSPRTGPFLKTLESVVARDPGFGPGWAILSEVYAQQSTANPAVPEGPIEPARRIVANNQAKAEMAARKAIELNPRDPGGYAALAFLERQRGGWAAAEDAAKQALALDPSDPDVLGIYAAILLRVAKIEEAVRIAQQAQALEPLLPAYALQTALMMHAGGRNQESIQILEAIPESTQFFFREVFLARAYAAEGRYADAADALLRMAAIMEARASGRGKPLQDAARILRSAPTAIADPKSLPRFSRIDGEFNFVYAYVGAAERMMDYFEREADIRYMPDFAKTIWTASAAPARKTERFKAFVRKAGLADYWRERGWPEFCHPTTGEDFECN